MHGLCICCSTAPHSAKGPSPRPQPASGAAAAAPGQRYSHWRRQPPPLAVPASGRRPHPLCRASHEPATHNSTGFSECGASGSTKSGLDSACKATASTTVCCTIACQKMSFRGMVGSRVALWAGMLAKHSACAGSLQCSPSVAAGSSAAAAIAAVDKCSAFASFSRAALEP
jgi:hypothetical protein